MPVRRISFALLLIAALHCGAAHAQKSIFTIHYPPEKIIKEYGLIGVSFSVQEGTDKVIVKVNSDKVKEIDRLIRVNCFSVHLEPGTNTIELLALKDGALVDKISRHVFLRSDLIGAYKHWPPDYNRDMFHSRKNELCAECHQLEPTEADKKPIDIDSPSAIASADKDSMKKSTCYSCHKGILSFPYVHGPASVWSCLSCHDENSKPRYAVAEPDSKICFKCHIDKKKEWMSKKYKHGPVTLGKCTICHSPHAAKYEFNLYKSTWDLCVNCHAQMGSGRHILADSFSQEGHPTKGKADPVRIGKELTCASCHDAHASDFPHLWAFDVNNVFELCQKCHHKKIER
jgi:predicted CXXCH cytochrome family protein